MDSQIEEQTLTATGKGRKPGRPTQASHCVGIVTSASDRSIHVSSGDAGYLARVAVSCLLQPEVGDSVACLLVAPNEVWILAVLTREDGVENRLQCHGPTRFDISDGPLTLGSATLNLESPSLNVRSEKVDVATTQATVVGRDFRFVGSTLRLVGSLFSSVFDRVSQFSKHYQRTTEGMDRVQATYVDQQAKHLMRVSGESTVITGQTLIKAQAEQVHLG